jgi:hypothetical protein
MSSPHTHIGSVGPASGQATGHPEERTVHSSLRRGLAATLARGVAVVVMGAWSLAAQAQPDGLDPEAQRILKSATDFLARQKQFSVDTRNTLEVVLKSGQKIELNHTARQSVQRPNKLRADRTGDLVEQQFIYDGRSLTLRNLKNDYYAQVSAPDTLEGMLDFARSSLDIVAPAGDLLYSNAYDILMDGVTQSLVVGKSVIEGVRCDQLAFRAPHVDLQVWVQEGPQPLVRRFVITTRDLPNAPQFAVTMTKWNLQPKFDSRTFRFVPPDGHKKIEFLGR